MWLNIFPVRYFELHRDRVRIRSQKGKLLMAVCSVFAVSNSRLLFSRNLPLQQFLTADVSKRHLGYMQCKLNTQTISRVIHECNQNVKKLWTCCVRRCVRRFTPKLHCGIAHRDDTVYSY